MTTVRLSVNGKPVEAEVEPRLQLAEFLREHLLETGTHLGCEHGICGACTVLIDGAPARSCIAYAVACEGAEVTTIEGLDGDATMAKLRRAFAREHALQCGFCTPGMLASARDIVLRLPDADARRIRLELAGNLCRCTGYVGIVRAIASVLEENRRVGRATSPAAPRRLGPVGARPAVAAAQPASAIAAAAAAVPQPSSAVGRPAEAFKPARVIARSFVLKAPPERAWPCFKEVELLAACLPGASLTRPVRDGQLEGLLRVRLGPIAAAFAGSGQASWDDRTFSGKLRGGGRDPASRSQVQGEIAFALAAARDGGTRVEVEIGFALAGPLAQFGRGAIVDDLAARLTAEFARNLDARIAARLGGRDSAAPAAAAELRAGSLLLSVIWARVKSWLKRALGRR